MKRLLYITGTKDKFTDGATILSKYGYDLEQKELSIDEFQIDDGEKIARSKAEIAYNELKQPLLVNDTVWMIPALNNFPNTYMKYVNSCFTPEDWLRLMSGIEDRRVIVREILVYKDATNEKVFFKDLEGRFLYKSSGIDGVPSDKVISFRSDSISVAADRDSGSTSFGNQVIETSYDLLGKWLQA